MRRYAFESLIAHFCWLVFIFLVTDGMSIPFAQWLGGFNQWDVRWYSSIAMEGHGVQPPTYAFPPLHGWVLGRLTNAVFYLTHALSFDVMWMDVFVPVAFIFGCLLFALANTTLVILAERRWKINRTNLWIATIANPMSYFALTAYSDATFYVLMISILLLATWTSDRREAWGLPELSNRCQHYLRAGLSALLFAAPWIRLTGFAFAMWAFLKRKEVIAIFLSLAAYVLYIWNATGDPIFFLRVQKDFGMPEGTIVSGFMMSIEILGAFFSGQAYQGKDFFQYAVNFGFLPMICLALSLWLVVWLARRDEKLWALAVLAITLVSHNQAFWRSTIRYALPLYPMMYWMILAPRADSSNQKRFAMLLRTSAWILIVGLSLAIQVYYCRLFRSGQWAY